MPRITYGISIHPKLSRQQSKTHHLLPTSPPDLHIEPGHFATFDKREFAVRLREIPSCELSQAGRDCIPSLHPVTTQCLAFLFRPQNRAGMSLAKRLPDCVTIAANKQKRNIYMSEPANTPIPVTAAPAASDSKPAACACGGAPTSSQPQPASTPATAPAAQKGSKRQNRKQH